MPSLYVVANQVAGSNGHLQIVRANGTTWTGSTNWVEVEVQSPALTLGNWDYRVFGQSFNTGGASAYYAAVTLAPTQTVDYVWELLGQVHASLKLNGAEIDYNVANQNSNSFIRTLMYVIGNDSNWSTAFSSEGLTSFPGWDKNVLFGAELGWSTSTGIALNLAGTAGNDIIRTGNGNDTLGGAAGNDSISSNSGNDTVRAGTGNDTLSGQNGNDSLFGDGGNDRLIGGAGSDVIYGGTGNDVIIGEVGLDKLYGGADSTWDVFVFGSGSTSKSSPDTVFDFVAGVDFIDLRQYDANSSASGDQAFVFGGQTAVARGIWCVDVGSDIIVYGDITGDTTSDFAIRVSGVNPLTSASFFL